ncbi:Bin3-type SAM domain-containing protein [Meloidogyne graminicola]|uniref:RNA methyltransferase n=1 Tax=Meloidogyne graminicola TaxID=189291 RepID=A0A8S9ZBV6_9BILA|nr:Bin3-type SAM domain-containing protein [Meloidogyne graminicola]
MHLNKCFLNNMEEDFTCSNLSPSELSSSTSTSEKKNKKSERFRYGNFSHFYDKAKGLKRLDSLPKEWFIKKRILDVGCNAGRLTLEIAKQFNPSWILGIDIDVHLVDVARKNIRHYFGEEQKFGKSSASTKHFNVSFAVENYVLVSDEYLEMVREEYDVILALSITKWIHLNWGDEGIKRFFKRTWRHLNQGGRLLIEFQDWSNYLRCSKNSPEMKETYKNIKFKPNQFKDYLINEVGFVQCQELGTSKDVTKGSALPILVFQKVNKLNTRKRRIADEDESVSPAKINKPSSGTEFDESFLAEKNIKDEFNDVNKKITVTDERFNGLSSKDQRDKVMDCVPENKKNKFNFGLLTRPSSLEKDNSVRPIEYIGNLVPGPNYHPTPQGHIYLAMAFAASGDGTTSSDHSWHAGSLQLTNYMLSYDLDPRNHRAKNETISWLVRNCFSKDDEGSKQADLLRLQWGYLQTAHSNSYNNFCNMYEVKEFINSATICCNIIYKLYVNNSFDKEPFLESLQGEVLKDVSLHEKRRRLDVH